MQQTQVNAERAWSKRETEREIGRSSAFGLSLYNERQKLPHIHAKYQGEEAVFSMLDGALLAGAIPLPKSRLVQAWIEIHREDLLADWELAVNGEMPFPIEPLR